VLPAGSQHNQDDAARGHDRPRADLSDGAGGLLPSAWHRTDRYANNRIEADHGRRKARLRPMRGLKQDRSARVIIAGQALVQNLRRGHDELAVEAPVNRRLAVAFDELALAI
jgi:transposase-like protein